MDSGPGQRGSVHIEHVFRSCSGVHWGRNSTGFLPYCESQLYSHLQLKQKEEDGGFELTVVQISWLGQLCKTPQN